MRLEGTSLLHLLTFLLPELTVPFRQRPEKPSLFLLLLGSCPFPVNSLFSRLPTSFRHLDLVLHQARWAFHGWTSRFGSTLVAGAACACSLKSSVRTSRVTGGAGESQVQLTCACTGLGGNTADGVMPRGRIEEGQAMAG